MSGDGDCCKTDPLFEEISCPKTCWPVEMQSQCQNIIFFFFGLRLLMRGVLLAEAAILVHFEAVGVVLFVLHGIVIALLALAARQRHLDSLIRCHA